MESWSMEQAISAHWCLLEWMGCGHLVLALCLARDRRELEL